MRTIWQSLLWKEWHEHKWKLASIAAVVCGTTTIALLMGTHDRFELAMGMQLLCIIPLALFVGLATAAGEQSRGTMEFLEALPMPMWRVAAAKILLGIVTLLVPVALMVACLYAGAVLAEYLGVVYRFSSQPFTGDPFLDTALFSSLLATSLYLWTASTGANRRDEISAGAVALASIAGYWILVIGVLWWTHDPDAGPLPTTWWRVVAMASGPGGPAILLNSAYAKFLALGIATALITAVILALWFIRRFGRAATGARRSPKSAVAPAGVSEWLAPPRRSPLSAIVWKQVRESGPLALAGLAGVAGCVALFVTPELHLYDWIRFAHVLGATTIYFYIIVSLVVGIGVFLNDLSPSMNTFWRTRPIHPDGWFWTKLVSGWAVLLASFTLPLLLIALYVVPARAAPQSAGDYAYVAVAPLAIYTSAVATTCLVRHAVYAAILSIAATFSGVAVVAAGISIARWAGVVARHPAAPMWALSEELVLFGLGISVALAVPLAWLAVRNDWGWKSRY